MLRFRAVLLTVAVALSLTACSGDDPEDPGTPSASGATSLSPGTPLPSAPPPDALEAARDGLREAGTARWELTVANASGGAVVTETGYVRIDPPASIAAALDDPNNESPKPDNPAFRNSEFHIVARPVDSLTAAAKAALELENAADGTALEAFERLRREVSRLEEELKSLTFEPKL